MQYYVTYIYPPWAASVMNQCTAPCPIPAPGYYQLPAMVGNAVVFAGVLLFVVGLVIHWPRPRPMMYGR